MSTATRRAISRACIAVGVLLLIFAAFMAGRHERILAFTTGLCAIGAIGGASVYLASRRRRS